MNNKLLSIYCPICGREIVLGTDFSLCCEQSGLKNKQGVAVFGEGDGGYIAQVHRGNIDSPEKRTSRMMWDKHYVNWCMTQAHKHMPPAVQSPARLKILSLGCGLGLDVAEMVSMGHDAYGLETVDLSEIYAELSDNAARYVVSRDGAIPFQDKTFDLIVSMNVLEHVGTIPPHEITTPSTDVERLFFVRQAVNKLKPGGIFLLITPNRNNPFDRGHSHYYMPFSYAMMRHYALTLTNPFDKRNFLPSPGDITRWCNIINKDIPISLNFIQDRSLFGLPEKPKKNKIIYWLREHKPKSLLPHIQAVIKRL